MSAANAARSNPPAVQASVRAGEASEHRECPLSARAHTERACDVWHCLGNCGRGGALAHSAAGALREHRPTGAAFLACLPRMPHGPTHLQYRRRCERAKRASAGNVPDQRAPIRSARVTCGAALEICGRRGALARSAAGAFARASAPAARRVAMSAAMLRSPTHLRSTGVGASGRASERRECP